MEQMTSKDAYTFPLWGSGFLVAIFLAVKFVSEDIVKLVRARPAGAARSAHAGLALRW